MKNGFKNLSTYMKTSIVTFGTGIFAALIFLVLGLCDVLPLFISLGIFLGSLISGFAYFLQDKITYLTCDDSKKLKYSMFVMFGSSLFLFVLGALIMILHFKASEETFKTVAMIGLGFLGSYLYTTVVYAIIYFGSKKCE